VSTSADFKALSAGGHCRPVRMLDMSLVSDACRRTKLHHTRRNITTPASSWPTANETENIDFS